MRGKTRVLSSFEIDTPIDLQVSSHLDTLMVCNTSSSDVNITISIEADNVVGHIFNNYALPADSVLDVLDSNPLNLKDARVAVSVDATDSLTVIYTAV